jgi:hypothetical protein
MTIIETIKQRRSVRSYTGEPLSLEHIAKIEGFIAGLEAPFGAKVRIELVHQGASDNKPVKLGTYGFIKGASEFLTLTYEKDVLAEESAAYLFEQVILFCTGLGLGTCWLGGSFSRKDFKKLIELGENEKLRIVSPVGYISDKKRFIEVLQGSTGNHISRKPFGSLFFHKDFSTPLTEELAGIYRLPLEMVRLGPSANNQQSWRVVQDDEAFHFYHHPSAAAAGFSAIDLGIALCHFEQTCKELLIPGKFRVFNNQELTPDDKGNKYSISWIAEEANTSAI